MLKWGIFPTMNIFSIRQLLLNEKKKHLKCAFKQNGLRKKYAIEGTLHCAEIQISCNNIWVNS